MKEQLKIQAKRLLGRHARTLRGLEQRTRGVKRALAAGVPPFAIRERAFRQFIRPVSVHGTSGAGEFELLPVRMHPPTPVPPPPREIGPGGYPFSAASLLPLESEFWMRTDGLRLQTGPYELTTGQVFALGDSAGNLWSELSFDLFGPANHAVLGQIYNGPVRRMRGEWVVIVEPQAPTYGHWLIELVPRLLWACEQLGEARHQYRWFLSGSGHPHERFVVERAGLDPDRVTWCHEPGYFVFDHAMVPNYASRGGMNISAASIDRMRRFLAPAGSPPHLRLYLSRRNEKFRRILNESEVIAELEHRGFVIGHPREIPLPEKIALCASAKIYATCLSSGTVHAAFMRPGGAFVEILPRHIFFQLDWVLAAAAGLHYVVVPDRSQARFGVNRYADVEADIPLLLEGIDRAEELGAPLVTP